MTTSTTTTKHSAKGFSKLSEEQQAELGTKFPIAYDNPRPVQRNNIAIFIVPNGLKPVREMKLAMFYQGRLKDIESFYGLTLDDGDLMVEFWATDRSDRSGNSNLNDHGYVNEEGDLHRFPNYIPLSLIKDLKEGDILRINGTQGAFTFQCLQRPYRYARFGTFEEVLKGLLAATIDWLRSTAERFESNQSMSGLDSSEMAMVGKHLRTQAQALEKRLAP